MNDTRSFKKDAGRNDLDRQRLGLTGNRTVRTLSCEAEVVGRVIRKGAEQARNQLPELLDAAEKGRTTIITKRGRPVAALVPLDAYAGAKQQQAITSLERSGRGLWGRDSVRRIRKLRDEWDR